MQPLAYKFLLEKPESNLREITPRGYNPSLGQTANIVLCPIPADEHDPKDEN
jgi:hypothetical protein